MTEDQSARVALRWIGRGIVALALIGLACGNWSLRRDLQSLEHKVNSNNTDVLLLKVALQQKGIPTDPKPWQAP